MDRGFTVSERQEGFVYSNMIRVSKSVVNFSEKLTANFPQTFLALKVMWF
jgi:hypothetical protein